MCLRAVRRTTYPNRYAYKIVKRVNQSRWVEGIGRTTIEGFRGPYYPGKALYQLNKKYIAKGRYQCAIRRIDPHAESYHRLLSHVGIPMDLGYARIRTGVHLYTRKADAYAYWRHKNRSHANWVILKCDIDKIEAYGDDAWGRAVVAMEVTPREVIWDRTREQKLRVSKR